MKTPKDWSIYVSNYKSKLKKIVAGINASMTGTGGGPPQGGSLSEVDQRFLALMGKEFGETNPGVSVNPFPDMPSSSQPSTSMMMNVTPELPPEITPEILPDEEIIQLEQEILPQQPAVSAAIPTLASATPSLLPRQARQTRYRSRPLTPLDEARRILAQVELQRATADAASARALELIGQNLGRLADAIERYLSR